MKLRHDEGSIDKLLNPDRIGTADGMPLPEDIRDFHAFRIFLADSFDGTARVRFSQPDQSLPDGSRPFFK